MTFTFKEKLIITLLLFLTYLLPSVPEWLQYKTGHMRVIGLSSPIWLVFFYIGPFWLNYGLNKFPFIRMQHVILRGALFVGLMYIGTMIVAALHRIAFSGYNFPVVEQITSAVLWGVFFFSMTQFYLMYLRLQQEKQLREQVQWVNLNNRLNPHFLFNSLNTISALMYHSVDEADDVLHKLSDILRYSLDKQAEQVSLEHEIAICRTYLAIEHARFTDNLVVGWQYDNCLVNKVKLPPLLLQPLIENAIKHVHVRPIKIAISIERQGDQLICCVQDNGHGFSEPMLCAINTKTTRLSSDNQGHGLEITAQRVALLNGDLTVINNRGALCQVRLPITSCV